jgi:hypothetical protein
MSEVDAGFLEVLASCTGAEGEVDYADDGWKPEDNEYTVLLEKFITGTKEKNGIANGWAKATFRIMNGDYEGRSFGEFFWLPSGAQKTTFGMSNLLRLGTCLCGRELKVAEIVEASDQANTGAGSAILTVEVVTTTSNNDGKTYTNTKFKSLVNED